MMKKHTTIFQFRPNGIKSLLLMLLLLVMGVGESVGQDIFTIHNTSISGVSLSWVTEDKCQIITTDDSDEAQQWIKEFVEGSTTDFYLKNVKRETYLAIADNDEDMTFVSSSELASKGNKAIFTLNDQGGGEYGIETKHQNKYLGTNAKTSGSLVYGNKEISANGKWAVNSRTTDYEPQYVAIHQNGTGYLKVASANVSFSNDGTFRYSDVFSNDGNSIWVLTKEGYLKNQYYYLNVTNNNTLYLSVDPVTKWEFDEIDDNGKMSIKYNGLYLCNSGGIKLLASPTASYRACPITITEVSWSGPTTSDVTVVSPQLVTYLRHYYTQKFTYTFVDDGGTTKTESDKERRIYATLTHADADNTDWGIVDGVIYNKKTKDNAVVTETYSISSSDPIALGEHPAEDKSIKLTVKQKPFAPNSSKNYILYSIKADDNYRYPYDDGIAGNGLLKANGKGGTGDASVLTDPANDQISWKISVDAKGFYSFKNVNTGNYIYFDDTPCTESYFGVLRVGASNIPSGDEGNKYKFKLYNFSNSDYNSCYQIIPYCRLDVVFKNDGMAGKLNACINNSDYKTHNVISLSVYDNSHWGIYTYEATYRLRNSDDMSINGPMSVDAIGNYTFTSSEAWYGKFISGSKDAGNQQRALVISGTYTTAVDYIWTVTGLGGYISIDGGSYNEGTNTWTKTINGNRNLVINVTNMPVSSTSGVIQVQWKGGSDGDTKWSGKKTFSFTIMGDGTVEVVEIDALSQITSANGAYKLSDDADVTYSETNMPTVETFSGILDGNNKTIIGLTRPLFTTLNNGTVRNLNIEGVNISMASSVGAVAGTANGGSRIYNVGILGGSVGSTDGNCGGLVGTLDGSARVINCFSYANITSGTNVGGIVGYNNYASTAIDLRTMVMNCIMYGDITGGTNRSPVYGGKHTSNAKGLNEYNYWRSKANLTYTAYNDQLAIDKDEYLTRFPFYRHILNTHRNLASYYIFGDYTDEHISEVGHWVLKRGENAPAYPVIEKFESNTQKVIGVNTSELQATTTYNRDYAGKMLTDRGSGGLLRVNYTLNDKSGYVDLPITDMDTLRYDYTYGKVMLPFASEFTGWTPPSDASTDYGYICTGWKITSVTKDGTAISDFDIPSTEPYNFADRDNPKKDIYDATNNPYIFAQGGNYIVPYGVTAINIVANFAKAYYLSDPAYDMSYNNSYGEATQVCGSVPTTYSGKTVYTNLSTLVGKLTDSTNPHSQAIVLVGNYHYNQNVVGQPVLNSARACTIMSIDKDNNQEPDFGWYSYHTKDRTEIPPLRFDFVPNIGIGMAARVQNSNPNPTIGIWHPKGWFETTETSLCYMSEFEINSTVCNENDNKYGNNRFVINSGYFIQIVRARSGNCTKLSYIQIGGNAYVKELYPGSHSDVAREVTIVPINVTGGEVEQCFMTGYNSGAKANGQNIYFWGAGGKIHKWLGAYMEKPQTAGVNVTAKIDHARIYRFFGGGTSSAASITGSINVTMNNSIVDFYCGGPEFCDKNSNTPVTTNAKGTTFGEYYGAGFGGTSITYRKDTQNGKNEEYTFNKDLQYPHLLLTFYSPNRLSYRENYGIGTCYKFEYILYSGGAGKGVARFHTGYAQFSLATTGNVTNNLEDCIIKKDFYGAGCQGKVNGTVTSTLKGCTVSGSAFGGGYKAESNDVYVYPTTQPDRSTYLYEMGIFTDFGTVEPEKWTWVPGSAGDKNEEAKTLSTQEDMNTLGNVTGDISLTITGDSKIDGDVYGGGNESTSLNNTSVTLSGNAQVLGNVFGGGNKAVVEGSATVNIGRDTSGTTTGPTP